MEDCTNRDEEWGSILEDLGQLGLERETVDDLLEGVLGREDLLQLGDPLRGRLDPLELCLVNEEVHHNICDAWKLSRRGFSRVRRGATSARHCDRTWSHEDSL